MNKSWQGPLEKIDDYRWRIPQGFMKGMRVPGIIYTNDNLVHHIRLDKTPEQVANVAHLPGIIRHSLAMPDIHWGYGFPIGGVAAVEADNGVISPGGVGVDINCGVRMLRTNLTIDEVRPKITPLVQSMYKNVPCGVGQKGKLRLNPYDLSTVIEKGASWAVEQGLGWSEDLEMTEENGRYKGSDKNVISERALLRGHSQLGTLGAGNHFLEIQIVDKIFDQEAAEVMGLSEGQICVMIHTGSRGFGYQVCDDYLSKMGEVTKKYNLNLPDRQLACTPIKSPEGQEYLAAMAGAANYAWTNRQIIAHWVRESFAEVLGKSAVEMEMHQIYDIAHNIAKFETHTVNNKPMELCVHRKGATRAFPPNHPEIPQKYKAIGQPVLIPGDMGTCSYVLVGTEKAMSDTFGSTCHGAGRVMSRNRALKATKNREISKELAAQGIIVMSRDRRTLREEAPEAYKDVNEVVDIVAGAGISKKVVKLRPLGVVKG